MTAITAKPRVLRKQNNHGWAFCPFLDHLTVVKTCKRSSSTPPDVFGIDPSAHRFATGTFIFTSTISYGNKTTSRSTSFGSVALICAKKTARRMTSCRNDLPYYSMRGFRQSSIIFVCAVWKRNRDDAGQKPYDIWLFSSQNQGHEKDSTT